MTDQDFQNTVLQQLSELKTGQEHLGDRITSLEKHVDARFEQVDARLDRVDARLDQVEDRLDRVDARLDQVEGRLDQVDSRFDQLEKEMKAGFQSLEKLLVKVFGSPIAEGVELYTDKKIREHEQEYHGKGLAAVA